MRMLLAKAVWVVAILAGAAAAGGWGYFIWSFDWGTSYRGRGLWLWIFVLPGMVVFVAVLFIVAGVLVALWEAAFREKFP